MSFASKIFGKLIIAIALIVVPFSMSHASMTVSSPKSKPTLMMDDQQHMHHSEDHQQEQHSSKHTSHKGHDNTNCCSSICGGALTVDVYQAKCLGFSKLIQIFVSTALEPGEWVLPFRPPST